MSTTSTDELYRHLQPTGGKLLLLLRAGLTFTEDGGPFLLIRRSLRSGLYTHEVQVTRPEAVELSTLALTGDDALAYASAKGWRSVLDPTAAELRDLMRQAVTLRDVAMWADEYGTYERYIKTAEYESRQKLVTRAHRAAAHRMRLIQW
ncbi:hypothetical protein [Streptomyces sp. NPDC004726]